VFGAGYFTHCTIVAVTAVGHSVKYVHTKLYKMYLIIKTKVTKGGPY